MVKTIDQRLSDRSLTEIEAGLVEKVSSYDRYGEYLSKLSFAIQFAKKAHEGQKRASGEEFFVHPMAVANILASISMDSLTIIVALLHDVVEDTEVSISKIKRIFGAKVASLVDGVTKLTKVEGQSENILQTENFRKLIVAMSKDIRILIIKLADRLHNMQTLMHMPSAQKRGKIALETMEIYAPLAERVGMHGIKSQLQDLSFAILYPASRDSILKRLNLLKKGDNIKLVQRITETLNELIEANGINVTVLGREKTPFSIWEKMKRKNISFEQLSDVMAFRVIVPDILTCYKALGVIHSNYHIIPGFFKDFISLPKQNRYQSIHTVIIGPEKQKIEVQIRTLEMQEVAENGIAVHWSYKQKYEDVDKGSYNWIKGLLKMSEETNDFSDLLENTKLEIYTDQVFCFTPKGAVIALPKGASVIDFAYAVHSDLGNLCVGAKINYKLAPLRTKLQNGDQIEILTSKDHKPLPSWERFVVTGKALSEIRKVIKQEKHKELFSFGKALLVQMFTDKKKDFSLHILEPVLPFFNKVSIEELVCSIGGGLINAEDVFKQIHPRVKLSLINAFSFLRVRKKKKMVADKSIPIKGLTPGISVHFSACCSPIPGDRIVGIRTATKGIAVHVLDCQTLQNYVDDPSLWIDLSWDKNMTKKTFIGAINIVLQNSTGSLAEVILEIAKNEANIANFKVINRAHDFFELGIDIETKGTNQLTNIIAAIKSKDCVHSVHRNMM